MPTITISKKSLINHLVSFENKKEKNKGKNKNFFSDSFLKEKISFLGTDLESIKGDDISVEIFPNRPDLLSQQGFNRAMGGFLEKDVGFKNYETIKINNKNKKTNRVIIDSSVKNVRPFTSCAIVRNLNLTDQLIKDIIQIQEKLHITYGRNRKRCAIGIYPLEHISLPITYTAKKPKDIVFVPLESDKELNGLQILSRHKAGREFAHLLDGLDLFPVFVDSKNNVLSMPPIINSEKTGRISESTTDVFIECSGFSYEITSGALSMIVCALSDMGCVIEEMSLEYPESLGGSRLSPDLSPREMLFDKDYINKYFGYDLSSKEIIFFLGKMGIGCKEDKNSKKLIALIPSYRQDILHPIDLFEDVAIAYGVEKVEAVIPRVATNASENSLESFSNSVRNILSGLSLIEIKNYNISSFESQTKLINSDDLNLVRVASSSSIEFNTLRKRVLPSVLLTLKKNKHHEFPQNLFEIGEVFSFGKSETGVVQNKNLVLSLCGESANYTFIRQHVDALFLALGVSAKFSAKNNSLFIGGRCANIDVDGVEIGFVGEINLEILENFDLEMPVASCEINLEKLFETINSKKSISF